MPKKKGQEQNPELFMTEMQRNYLDIAGQISNTLLTEEDAERYSEFNRWTWAITQLSEDFYRPDESGNYPVMDEPSLKAFRNTYHRALHECDKVLKENSNDGISGKMKEISKQVKEMLEKDSAALEAVVIDKEHPMTLDDIIGLGRTITVDFGDQQVVSKGAALSSRIPVQVPDAPGGALDGYFTASSYVRPNEDTRSFFGKFKEKYPDLKNLFDHLENTSPSKIERHKLMDISPDKAVNEGNGGKYTDDPKTMKKAGTAYFADMLRGLVPAEELSEIKKKPQFFQAMCEFSKEYPKLSAQIYLYTDKTSGQRTLRLDPGCNVDKRNAAMSAVSSLVGKKGLIAEAQPMIAIINGKPVAGTFMTKAFDYCSTDITEKNPMMTAKAENYNNPAIFDDIAAMQAIDFICGNIDRHSGNYMLRFGEVDGKTKAIGITGIDNDLSFGMNVPEPNSSQRIGKRFVLPSEMGVIGKQTAQKILSIQEDQLRLTLSGYGLRKAEIDAACQRTKILQDAIKEGAKYYKDHPMEHGTLAPGHLRIVPENEWNKYSLQSLANTLKESESKKMNQFAVLNYMDKIVASTAKRRKREAKSEERSNEIRQKVFGQEIKPKQEIKPLEGKPIGTGIKYQVQKADMLGVDNPETIKVVIPEDEKLGKLSGANSSRIPVSFDGPDGKPKNGFFTAATFVSGKNQVKQFFDREIAKQSGENGHPEWADVLKRTYAHLQRGLDADRFAFNNYDLKKLGYDAETADRLKNDDDFNTYYQREILQPLYNIPANLQLGYIGFGADRNGTIEKRNVAMSKVGDLLGAPTALARSTTMQVQVGDKITDGVFMDEAPGMAYTSIRPGDKILEHTATAFDGSPALKDIANIQILDYICMNVDRNKSNLFYQFSKDGTKCIGVTGIDNDLSFGTLKLQPNKHYLEEPPLNDIKVVTVEMAEKIKSISHDALVHTLEGQGLTQNEINAAVERFTSVRDRIKSGQIRTVTDEEWKQMKLSDLAAESQSNLFANVSQTFSREVPSLMNTLKPDTPRGQVTYTHGEKVQDFSKEVIEKTKLEQTVSDETDDLLDQFSQSFRKMNAEHSMSDAEILKFAGRYADTALKNVKEGTSILHGQSQFYTDLSERAAAYANYTKQLTEKVKNGGELSSEDFSGLISGVNSLNDAAGKYISHVNDTAHPSRTQQKRKKLAEQISRNTAKMRSLVQVNSDMREVEAKPEEVMHRKIKNRQEYLTAHGNDISDEAFKQNVATMIYLNLLKQNAVQLVKGKKMINALMQSTHDKNIEQIMATPAFGALISQNKKEQIIEMVNENTGSKLLSEYAKNRVQLAQAEAADYVRQNAVQQKKEKKQEGIGLA